MADTSNAFAGLLAQIQNSQQERLDLIQAQLAEDLDSWKAEQRTREDALKVRVAALESEVTRLREEVSKAHRAMPEPNAKDPAPSEPAHT